MKLKAIKSTVCYLTKIIFSVPTKKTSQVLYLASFLENLRDKLSFFDLKEDKLTKYWVDHPVSEIILMADRMYDEEKYVEVYELLNRMKFSNEIDVIWRLVRALYKLAQASDTTAEIKKEMMEEAHGILLLSAPFGEGTADFHKWYAIILDAKNGLESLEHRIRTYPLVRDQLIKACELCPEDYSAHYMLGRWYYEMANLTWFQRKIAKYLFEEAPKCSFQDAFDYLSKAEDLQPRSFLPTLYLLGRCCVMLGQYYRAKYYLTIAIGLPANTECEKCCVLKANKLMKQLEKYDLGKDILFDQYSFGYHE